MATTFVLEKREQVCLSVALSVGLSVRRQQRAAGGRQVLDARRQVSGLVCICAFAARPQLVYLYTVSVD